MKAIPPVFVRIGPAFINRIILGGLHPVLVLVVVDFNGRGHLDFRIGVRIEMRVAFFDDRAFGGGKERPQTFRIPPFRNGDYLEFGRLFEPVDAEIFRRGRQ